MYEKAVSTLKLVRTGLSVAEHLGVDLGAALLGVLELLEHQHAGALRHDEAVALHVERPRRALGPIIESVREHSAIRSTAVFL